MKKFLPVIIIAMLGCSIPIRVTFGTPTAIPASTATPVPTAAPPATAEPGSDKNPLILALSPSPRPSQAMIEAGNALAAQLEALTGYRIVAIAPASEADLMDSFGKNNAHIAALSPFAYLLAHENGGVTAALASVRDGQAFYGAQFIVNRESEFRSYYDETRGENTAQADEALAQFKDKKPCWSDPASPSGYVVPLGLLNQAEVPIRSGAFLEGQPSVVRAVYADDICDFGATYIDARNSPALESDYPDVMDKVIVVWRVPPVIPYENISFASSLPLEMRRVLLRAFVDLMLTPEGRAAMQTVYGVEALQVTEDGSYIEFSNIVQASNLDLEELIDAP
jgi:phosphonate transport system substrate-binding protein